MSWYDKKNLKKFMVALGIGFFAIEACMLVLVYLFLSLNQFSDYFKINWGFGIQIHLMTILLIIMLIWGFWSLMQLKNYSGCRK